MKRNLFLSAFLVLLAVFFIYIKFFHDPFSGAKTPVISLGFTKITGLSIAVNGINMKFSKDSVGWHIIFPLFDCPMDSPLYSILEILTSTVPIKILKVPLDDQRAFGISNAESSVLIVEASSSSDTIRIGSFTPDQQYVYTRKNSEPFLYIMPLTLKRLAWLGLENFRRASISCFPSYNISKIIFLNTSKETLFDFSRSYGGGWVSGQSTTPISLRDLSDIIFLFCSRDRFFVAGPDSNISLKFFIELVNYTGCRETLEIYSSFNGICWFIRNKQRNLWVRIQDKCLDTLSNKINAFKNS